MITCAPNVFATSATEALLKTFCSCPAAAALLASSQIVKPLLVYARKIPIAFTAKQPSGAVIVIPEINLAKAKGLSSLAFEIFNSFTIPPDELAFRDKVFTFHVGMDAFAKKSEEFEHRDTLGVYALRTICAKTWNLPFDMDLKLQDPVLWKFEHETTCHTDAYRAEWIRSFQKDYCKEHPEDTPSCSARSTNLCDAVQYHQLPPQERAIFSMKRICALFPCAHERVRENDDYKAAITAYCPEALSKAGVNCPDEEQKLLVADVRDYI